MDELFPYGLDAPPVVRNLAAAALACWLVFGLSFIDGLPLHVHGMAWPAAFISFGALAMPWSSRYGKLRRRENLLDRLPWRGDEQVVDLGCGRGLLAVAAARRAPRGQVTGIDIWQTCDLSGNGPRAVALNAAREGVADRLRVTTADMRALPLADASVDLVVTSYAIHNIYQPEGRARAIDEAIRVLRPGGHILLDDMRHLGEYASRLRAAGFELNMRRDASSWLWRLISLGSLAPGTLMASKPAA